LKDQRKGRVGEGVGATERWLVLMVSDVRRLIETGTLDQERSKTVATVLYILTALKPGVDAEEYERFEREVDYPFSAKLETIVSYRIHRLTEPAPFEGGPWNYIERIEVTDRAAYLAAIATDAKDLIDTLHEKYLDESKTKMIWSTRIDP
jgi:hypothetical protein